MLKIHFPFFEVELVTVLLILRVFFFTFARMVRSLLRTALMVYHDKLLSCNR